MNSMDGQKMQGKDMKKMQTGTTTLGLITDKGVVLAADNRATIGHLKASKKAKKVFKLHDDIAMTIAGSVGDAQKIVRLMRAQINLYNIENRDLSVKGASTLLSNVLNANKMLPFMNQFIIGGTNPQDVLYDLDPVGGLMDHKEFTATGSGSPTAYGVLEDRYEEDIPHEEGIKLAIRAIKAASERDTASGDGMDVVTITEEGYQELDESDIEEYLG